MPGYRRTSRLDKLERAVEALEHQGNQYRLDIQLLERAQEEMEEDLRCLRMSHSELARDLNRSEMRIDRLEELTELQGYTYDDAAVGWQEYEDE